MDDLKTAVSRYQKRVEEAYWVEDESGNKIERWRKYGSKRRIAQAACSYNGYIVTGTRHFCPIMRLQIETVGVERLRAFCGNSDNYAEDNIIQGFTDQYGMFLTREEAYVIAKEAGQIIREDTVPGVLFSECYI